MRPAIDRTDKKRYNLEKNKKRIAFFHLYPDTDIVLQGVFPNAAAWRTGRRAS
jgi:hypothetical protein